MVEKNNLDEVKQESPGDSQPCCSPAQGSGSCCSSGSGGGRSWKTAIFVVVMLLAGAVAAHSLLTRGGETASVSDDEASPLNIAGSHDKAGLYTESDSTSNQPSKAAAISCGVTLDSINSLGRITAAKGVNVVFIFLAGENEEPARTASAQIEATMNLLLTQGKQVAAFTLRKDSEGHDQLIREFRVESLPCVIVAGRGCGSAAVWGEITESKLLGAFIRASTPVPSCVPGTCGPGSGPSCYPPRPKK